MASFFGVNIETPQEAQERLRQEMLGGLAFNQKQSALQGVGYALSQVGQQAAQKWGGVVPEPVRIAQETEAVVQGGLDNYNTRMAKQSESGEDPLLIQSEEFIKAASALRSVNPQASREFMQKAVETRQAYEEQKYSRGRLAAADKRAEEGHRSDMGQSVEGIDVLLEQAENIKDPAVKQKRVAELNERKQRMLRDDPEYQQVELADGMYWVNKRTREKHYIGPVYRAPVKGSGSDKADAESLRDPELQAQDDRNVLAAISVARDYANQMGTTGVIGQGLRNVGGTDAYNLGKSIETIQANIGFSRLQRMRDESKTGGALGQVAVKELELLMATVANLDPNQDRASLLRSLKLVEDQYKSAVEKYEAAMAEKAKMEGSTAETPAKGSAAAGDPAANSAPAKQGRGATGSWGDGKSSGTTVTWED